MKIRPLRRITLHFLKRAESTANRMYCYSGPGIRCFKCRNLKVTWLEFYLDYFLLTVNLGEIFPWRFKPWRFFIWMVYFLNLNFCGMFYFLCWMLNCPKNLNRSPLHGENTRFWSFRCGSTLTGSQNVENSYINAQLSWRAHFRRVF